MKRLIVATFALCLILCGCGVDEVPSSPGSEPPTFWEQVEIKMEENETALKEAQERQNAVEKGQFFQKVAFDSVYGFSIYRDIRTDVMYLYDIISIQNGRGCAITVMLDMDGKPLTYSAWKQMEGN